MTSLITFLIALLIVVLWLGLTFESTGNLTKLQFLQGIAGWGVILSFFEILRFSGC